MRFARLGISVTLAVLCIVGTAFPQWSSEWTSGGISSDVISGWLRFQRAGNQWNNRFYTLDTLAFRIMSSPYSQTAEYTYWFTPPERLAGNIIYSLDVDLTGDGIVEFYVLAQYGTAAPYRQGFRIFNITNQHVLFQRDDAAHSYSYPQIWDVDGDGLLECLFTRTDYPSLANYVYEVYETGAPASLYDASPALTTAQLGMNWPNPFNTATSIPYELHSPAHVRLEVFNALGQRVAILQDGIAGQGAHSLFWNGTDETGIALASGTYFYRLRVNGVPAVVRSMQLVR